LENKLMVKIGICSYFLYLIHEYAGVLLIRAFGKYFYPVSFILSLLVAALLIVVSIFYTHHIDRRISNFLKKILLPKKIIESPMIALPKPSPNAQ
jgi:peptidoglycan/LPS O-acetylase OafA/YrhL